MTTLLRRSWRAIPLRLFVIFLAIYGLTAGVSVGRHSLAPHFVYLAESFLHGHLDLMHVPDPPYDLTPFEGQWYVSFPPLPALLMLLPVAIRGLAVSDIAFSVVLGALNITLFWTILARLEVGDWRLQIGLCVLLGLGTPLWYCAAFGSVWYTAHVAAITCLCFYVLEVVGRNRPWLAGLCLGLGFLARAPVLLTFPLSLVLGFQKSQDIQRRTRFLLLFAFGMAPALLGQAAYNWARFGNPLEFGYRWMNSPGPLLARQMTWGQFSLHFLPENLYTLLIRPPLVSLTPLRIEPDPWGMGLLFTCPALLLALPALTLPPDPSPRVEGGAGWGLEREGVPTGQGWARALRLGLWLSVGLVQIPSLLYFNTGSYQFGYRFALDWMPLGVLLVALGVDDLRCVKGRRCSKALVITLTILIVASVLMHLWGVSWMYPNFNGRLWHLQYVELVERLLR
ncbi:MAG: hypothetical protein SXV54_21520 [Chloroflexota bacterium]|nr:hypothetical protein [Chloroflexota bacterium]